MELQVARGSVTQQNADTIVVTVPEDRRRLSGAAAEADRALRGAITRERASGLISGRRGEVTILPGGRLRAKRVLIVGAGKREPLDLVRVRNGAANLARRLRGMRPGRVAWSLQHSASGAVDAEAHAAAVAEGILLGLYRFDRHHTREADRPRGTIDSITLVEPGPRGAPAATRGVEQARILAEATNLARDLVNEPANLMTPTVLASRAQQIAADDGLECTIIERAEAERLKMGSYLSVAAGSVEPPKFIVLRYRSTRSRRTVGLIGKGITFDTGGISLKPAAGAIQQMKTDMAGAAAVLGAMQAIARLRPAVNVTAVAPCTENMPSGSATKPGDVVYAMDGQSIEILNTDAEGRLVLADGIVYAKGLGCTTLIDVATLTGAISTTLGSVRFGLFTNNDRLHADLERAATAAGERLWRLPMDREYDELIKSTIADIKNTGTGGAGSIVAAKFIERFVGDTPWAHLDIAGVANTTTEKGVNVRGATGQPVRTLVHYVLGQARR